MPYPVRLPHRSGRNLLEPAKVPDTVKLGAAPRLVAKDKRYPSDLTDAQWELIEPLVPTPQGRVASGDAFAAPDRGLGP